MGTNVAACLTALCVCSDGRQRAHAQAEANTSALITAHVATHGREWALAHVHEAAKIDVVSPARAPDWSRSDYVNVVSYAPRYDFVLRALGSSSGGGGGGTPAAAR